MYFTSDPILHGNPFQQGSPLVYKLILEYAIENRETQQTGDTFSWEFWEFTILSI